MRVALTHSASKLSKTWGKRETFKGVNFVVYWWWMQRKGARKWRSGDDANLLLPYFYKLPALFSQLSVFSKLCIMNTFLQCLLLLCQSSRSLRNVSLGGHILGLIKSAYHGWLSMMTSSQAPIFKSCLEPPNPKPTTVYSNWSSFVATPTHYKRNLVNSLLKRAGTPESGGMVGALPPCPFKSGKWLRRCFSITVP